MNKKRILVTSAVTLAGCATLSQISVNNTFAMATGPDCDAEYTYCHEQEEDKAKAINPVFRDYDYALCALDTYNNKVKTGGTNTTLSDAELAQITDIYCSLPGAGAGIQGFSAATKKMTSLEKIEITTPGADEIDLEKDTFSYSPNLKSIRLAALPYYDELDLSSNLKLEFVEGLLHAYGNIDKQNGHVVILPSSGKLAGLNLTGYEEVDLVIDGAVNELDTGSAMPLAVNMEKAPFLSYIDTLVYGVKIGDETTELSYTYDENNDRIILTPVVADGQTNGEKIRFIFNNTNSQSSTDDEEEVAEHIDILEGADQEMNAKEIKDLVIRYDRDITLFDGLKIDGKDVPEESYTLASGSTIVTIKASYIENLAVGDHKVSAYFAGEGRPIETNFTIKAKSSNTGLMTEETASMVAFPAILSILAGALVSFGAFAQLKKYSK